MVSIVDDTSGTTAKALTGSTREEAIKDAAFPEPAMPDGSVPTKPMYLAMNKEEAAAAGRIEEMLAEATAGAYTKQEHPIITTS
jgi:hypothetical protein